MSLPHWDGSGERRVLGEPISPELALIDPELALRDPEEDWSMIDPLDPRQDPASAGNGSTAAAAAEGVPSVETLLFGAGVITADQLGELVRDAVLSQRPVAALAVERGLTTPEMLERLLMGAAPDATPAMPLLQGPSDPLELVPTPENGVAIEHMAAVVPVPAPSAPSIEDRVLAAAPPPAPVVALPASLPTPDVAMLAPFTTPAAAAAGFAVLLRLQSGERIVVDTASSVDRASEVARALAGRFATASEWPLVAGRYIRPEAVVSVDVERTLEADPLLQ